ncbi:MAG: SixA phosphatase family protein [Bacteroidia bacterium]
MKKTLILVRHAKSEWDVAGVSDFNRPLSEGGIQKALRTAYQTLHAGYKPELILTSAALRAYHTAHLFAQVMSLPHNSVQPLWELYGAESATVQKLIVAKGESLLSLAVVGHNPTWSQLSSFLSQKAYEMPTSGVLVWEVEDFSQVMGPMGAPVWTSF